MLFRTSLDCLSCKYALKMEIVWNCRESFEMVLNGFVYRKFCQFMKDVWMALYIKNHESLENVMSLILEWLSLAYDEIMLKLKVEWQIQWIEMGFKFLNFMKRLHKALNMPLVCHGLKNMWMV